MSAGSQRSTAMTPRVRMTAAKTIRPIPVSMSTRSLRNRLRSVGCGDVVAANDHPRYAQLARGRTFSGALWFDGGHDVRPAVSLG